jgi:hypothetical protein
LPLSISIYDALRIQRPRQSENEESPDGSIYDARFVSLQRTIRGSRWRYIPPACALVLGSYMALGLWSGLTSTYICPLVVGETRSIPLMQWLGAALDSFLAIATYELCLPQSTPFGTSRGRGPTIWSTILIVGCPKKSVICTRLTECQGNSHSLVDCWHFSLLWEAAVPTMAYTA